MTTARLEKTPLFPTQAIRIADTEIVCVGEYVVIDTDGDVRRVADTTDFIPLGHVVGFNPPGPPANEADGCVTGDTSAARKLEAIVDIAPRVVEKLAVVGVTGETDKGALVFATGPNTYTLTPTSNISAVGWVQRFRENTIVDVAFFSANEIRAL